MKSTEGFPGKVPYARILQMDRMLRSGLLPALPDLSKRFGISQRTIERDVECLRDYFKAPLVYDRVAKRYRYGQKNYRLPAISLTESELISVLVTERLMRQYAGTPFQNSIRRAFEKLVAMLPEKAVMSVDVANLCRAMVFEQGVPVREYSLEVFTTLFQCILEKERVEVVYYTRQGNREEGTRFLDPYHMANLGGEWYLLAHCSRRKAVHTFHVGRIREAYALDIPFTVPDDFAPLAYLARESVTLVSSDTETVRVRIVPSASKWVKEKVWHFTQKFERVEDDGSAVLRMEIPNDVSGKETVLRWVLQLGGEAEVLEPAWLKRDISARLKEAIRNYEKD